MKGIGSVLRKEFREVRRDRRVLFGTFVMPLFVIFLMIQMFATIEKSLGGSQGTKVGVVSSPAYATLADSLAKTPTLSIVRYADLATAKADLEKGEVRTVIAFPAAEATSETKSINVQAFFTSDATTSVVALRRIEAWKEAANRAGLQQALQMQGLPASLGEVLKMETQDIAKSKGAGESLLVSLLPYLVVLFMFAGGMAVASDLVAGEKERGTLETLLVSPLSRMEVALGKWIAIVILCTVTGFVNVVGLFVIGSSNPAAKKMLFTSGFGVSAGSVVGMLLTVISLAFVFAGAQLAISAHAKNMREAQTYMAVANFFVVTPAVLSQIIGMTDLGKEAWVQWTPVLNTALGMRDALLGKATMMSFAAPIIVNLTLGAIGIGITLALFRREAILTKS